MKQIIIKFVTLLTVTGALLLNPLTVFAASPILAADDPFGGSKGAACQGVSLGSSTDACASDSSSGLSGLLKSVIQILSVIVGAVAVIMVIVGGLRYVTSGGEASNTGAAKNTIMYALIGLVIVALAQVLVHFVLNRVAAPLTSTTCPTGQTGTPPNCKAQ